MQSFGQSTINISPQASEESGQVRSRTSSVIVRYLQSAAVTQRPDILWIANVITMPFNIIRGGCRCCVAVPALLKWISEKIFPGCGEEAGEVREGNSKGRNRRELPLLKPWAGAGTWKKVCCHGNHRAPTTRGWQQDPCSFLFVFFWYDSLFHFSSCPGRGMGFVLTHIILLNTRFPWHQALFTAGACSTEMLQGSTLGPIPFFTL